MVRSGGNTVLGGVMTSCNQGLSPSDQVRQRRENQEFKVYTGDKKIYISNYWFWSLQ